MILISFKNDIFVCLCEVNQWNGDFLSWHWISYKTENCVMCGGRRLICGDLFQNNDKDEECKGSFKIKGLSQ